MKRIFVLIISVFLLLSACSQPSSQSSHLNTVNDPGQTEFKSGHLTLRILSPKDGDTFETNSVEVKGVASPESVISINDELVIADKDGKFQVLVTLSPGLNLIEILASNVQGDTISHSMMVDINVLQ